MKRLLVIALIFLVAPLWAQQGEVVLCEGFYNAWLTEGWDVSGDNWAVWYLSNTSYAGGKAHEMQMYPDYNFLGTTMLTSPFVELDKYDYINIQFNHSLQSYDISQDGVIGIGISNDGMLWESIWLDTVTGSIDQSQYLLTFDMEEWDNKSNFFCFYYTGNGACVRNWYLDNIIIYASKKDKYGRIGESDERGFIATRSQITSLKKDRRKGENQFTTLKKSKNKYAKIVNGKR